jgi:hypothetical protein
MVRNSFRLALFGALLYTLATSSSTAADSELRIPDLRPFTHYADIPAGFDTGSIRFEKVKRLELPIRIRFVPDPFACLDDASKDCQYKQAEFVATAYEVTYSYTGPPLASDEFGNRRFTFDVYFWDSELPAQLNQWLTSNKRNRADAGRYLAVKIYPEPMPRERIDDRQSSFCEGSFNNGLWIHSATKCEDRIVYAHTVPSSGYMTVRVDPVGAQLGRDPAMPVSRR